VARYRRQALVTLAAEHGVELGTARRAISELRGTGGLAVTLPAKGTFIVSREPGR
jgi:DNA-binding transcriptional regulator YhcF (GntR family)